MKANEDELRQLIVRVNQLLHTPYEMYKTGSMEANINCFFLRRTTDGYTLRRMIDRHGNSEDVFRLGAMTKKSLYGCITGFIMGIEKAKQEIS